jgi:hypothetical protein
MARPAGLEPATLGLEGRCSIRLSYGRIFCDDLLLANLPGLCRKNDLVGVERFELPTSCSQSRRATRLRYTPYYRLGLQGRKSYVVAAPASTRQTAFGREHPAVLDFKINQQSNVPSRGSARSMEADHVPELQAFLQDFRSRGTTGRHWTGLSFLPRRAPSDLPLAATGSNIPVPG